MYFKVFAREFFQYFIFMWAWLIMSFMNRPYATVFFIELYLQVVRIL